MQIEAILSMDALFGMGKHETRYIPSTLQL